MKNIIGKKYLATNAQLDGYEVIFLEDEGAPLIEWAAPDDYVLIADKQVYYVQLDPQPIVINLLTPEEIADYMPGGHEIAKWMTSLLRR